MIEFVLGRAGSGKTTYIEKTLWRSETAYYLVPEQASMQKERAMQLAAAEKGKPMPTVITFRRLCDLLMREYGGMARQKMGTVAQYAMIYRAVLCCEDRLSFYAKNTRTFSFYEKLASVFEEFSIYGVDPTEMERVLETAPNALQRKYRDLLMLYTAYEKLRGEKYRDAEDDMALAIRLLQQHKFFENAALFIDGFYGFTPRQQQMLALMMAQAKHSVLAATADEKEDLFSSIRRELFALQKMLLEYGKEPTWRLVEKEETASCGTLALMERHLFDLESVPPMAADGAVRLYAHKNQSEEVAFVAADIRRRVLQEGVRYKDIAILCADSEAYEREVRSTFEAQQIPLFIDARSDLMAKPMVAFLLYAIDTVCYNYRFEDVFSFIKTGLCGLTGESAAKLENYVKRWNIKGREWTQSAPWTKNPLGLDQKMDDAAQQSLAEIDAWRRKISEPLVRFREKTETGNATELLTALWQLGADFHLEEQLQKMANLYYETDPRAAEECLRLYDIWIDTLDELAEVLGDTEIDRKTLQNMLKVCLAEVNIGSIPPTMDQVSFGEVSHTRFDSVKYIYLLGVNQGALPAFPLRDSLITDGDIAFLRQNGITLSKESTQNAGEQQYRLYASLCKASEGIVFNYTFSNAKGEEQLPSEYIDRLREIIDFSAWQQEAVKTEYLLTHASAVCRYAAALPAGSAARKIWRNALVEAGQEDIDAFIVPAKEKKLSTAALERLYGRTISLSQSRMQSFVDCPFKYFLEYGLSLQEEEEATLDAAGIGTFLHAVMEHYLAWIAQRESLPEETESKQALDEIVDRYLQTEMKDLDGDNVNFMMERLRKTLYLAAQSVTDEIKNSDFAPKAVEMDVSGRKLLLPLQDGFFAKINGIIDRVDIGRVEGAPYYKIVDYKSGEKRFSFEKIFNGYDLQLPLYAYACSKLPEFEGAKLAAMEYLHVGIPQYKLEKNIPPMEMRRQMVKDKLPSQFYRSGIFHNDMKVLQALEAGTDGKYTVRYTAKGIPRADAMVSGDTGLQSLMNFAKEKAIEIGNQIVSGKVEAEPFKINHNSCEYCDYHALCRFDYATHKYRKYQRKDDIDFSQLLDNQSQGGV